MSEITVNFLISWANHQYQILYKELQKLEDTQRLVQFENENTLAALRCMDPNTDTFIEYKANKLTGKVETIITLIPKDD